MINWLKYLIEVNAYLCLAYGGYWLLLRRQTFYSANRAYLLASALLCFAIPLVQISFTAPEIPSLPQMLTRDVFSQSIATASLASRTHTLFEPFKAITALYTTGVILRFVLLCAKLYKLLKLISTSKTEKRDGYTLVTVPETPSPFSFMGYLFVSNEAQLQPVILKHELVHTTQKHSYDVLFTEILKVLCWFNPTVHLLQNSLKTLHEFEADRLTAEKAGKDGYVDFLIAQACQHSGISFANHFSEKQLLKSRITKLYQKRSGKLARLNYAVALPLFAGMLCVSSSVLSKDFGLKLRLQKSPVFSAKPLVTDKKRQQVSRPDSTAKLAPAGQASGIIIGSKPEFDPGTKSSAVRKVNIVYIQVDKGIIVKPGLSNNFNRNARPAYLVDGKFYTLKHMQKRSNAMIKNGKIQPVFHAEEMVYYKPDDKEMIARYGDKAKNGVWDFKKVFWSEL